MNKFIQSITFYCLCSVSFCSTAQVPIYITAKVIEKSCSIVEDDILVDMGLVNSKNIQVGEAFANRSFAIALNDCPPSTSMVHVKLSTSSGASKYIENESIVAPSTGYAIVVYDSNNTELDMRNNQTDFTINPSDALINLNFTASFIKTNNSPSNGEFIGVTQFEISYD